MVKVNELRGLMVARGYTQEQLEKKMGISSRTLGTRFKKGIFQSDEMELLIKILEIKNPAYIFFNQEVA